VQRHAGNQGGAFRYSSREKKRDVQMIDIQWMIIRTIISPAKYSLWMLPPAQPKLIPD
jgi:hypothetical protein